MIIHAPNGFATSSAKETTGLVGTSRRLRDVVDRVFEAKGWTLMGRPVANRCFASSALLAVLFSIIGIVVSGVVFDF